MLTLGNVLGVVWCRPWMLLDSPHFEFHTQKEDPTRSGAPGVLHIQNIVLRINTLDGALALQNNAWPEVQQCLAQLPFLRPIIIETNGGVEEDLVQALRDAGVEVRWRRSEEAHELALRASEQTAPHSRTEPVSPFWYLEAYRPSWASW